MDLMIKCSFKMRRIQVLRSLTWFHQTALACAIYKTNVSLQHLLLVLFVVYVVEHRIRYTVYNVLKYLLLIRHLMQATDRNFRTIHDICTYIFFSVGHVYSNAGICHQTCQNIISCIGKCGYKNEMTANAQTVTDVMSKEGYVLLQSNTSVSSVCVFAYLSLVIESHAHSRYLFFSSMKCWYTYSVYVSDA